MRRLRLLAFTQTHPIRFRCSAWRLRSLSRGGERVLGGCDGLTGQDVGAQRYVPGAPLCTIGTPGNQRARCQRASGWPAGFSEVSAAGGASPLVVTAVAP
jgi:hypothetical protein